TLSDRTRDTTVASVGQDATVRSRGNGTTWLVVRAGADSVLGGVRVAQRPVRVVLPSDTINITAIGDTAVVSATAVDSLGYAVTAPVQVDSVTDASVARLLGPTTLQGLAKGTATAAFMIAGLPSQVIVAVNPVPARISAQLT